MALAPYFAGRFDGDGTFGTTPRICYTTRAEADLDAQLLARAGVTETSILFYAKAREHCVYVKRAQLATFSDFISPYSWKASKARLDDLWHPA